MKFDCAMPSANIAHFIQGPNCSTSAESLSQFYNNVGDLCTIIRHYIWMIWPFWRLMRVISRRRSYGNTGIIFVSLFIDGWVQRCRNLVAYSRRHYVWWHIPKARVKYAPLNTLFTKMFQHYNIFQPDLCLRILTKTCYFMFSMTSAEIIFVSDILHSNRILYVVFVGFLIYFP